MNLNDADFLVEANYFAFFRLLECLEEDEITFHQLASWSETIATVLGHNIIVAFEPIIIKGKVIIFYECISALCYKLTIEDWLKANFDKTWDEGRRWAHCNAMNFHLCRKALSV